MAIRFDIAKYEKVKQAYISQLYGEVCPFDLRQCFSTYSSYLDSDKDVLEARNRIREQKQQEKQRKKEQQEQIELQREARRLKQIEDKKRAELQRKQKKLSAPKYSPKPLNYSSGTSFYAQNNADTYNYRPIAKVRPVSASTRTLADIDSYNDLNDLMSSSVFETLKKQADLDHLRRLIRKYCQDHPENQKKWLAKVEEKEKSIAAKNAPKMNHKSNFVPKPTKLIYIAAGGMTTYKRKR